VFQEIRKWFCFGAGAILALTGIAKVLSGLGHTQVLSAIDPVLGLRFGDLLIAVGVLELLIATFCFCSKSSYLAPVLVAWLATNILVYRLGLWVMGWHRPCSCLGTLTDAIHLPPQLADNVMKGVLAYLLIGSYGSLFWLWRHRKRALASASA
jgi:hypothetical protein